jgi:hypothetical protein
VYFGFLRIADSKKNQMRFLGNQIQQAYVFSDEKLKLQSHEKRFLIQKLRSTRFMISALKHKEG